MNTHGSRQIYSPTLLSLSLNVPVVVSVFLLCVADDDRCYLGDYLSNFQTIHSYRKMCLT